MKMIQSSTLFKLLILAVGLFATTAIPAQGQAVVGTFALAHKTYWSGVALPAGDYTFSLDTQNWPGRITVRDASGAFVGIFLARSTSEERTISTSSLVLHRQASGESVVSALRLANLGLNLEFAAPKTAMPVAETAKLGPIAEAQPGK